jgi:hypothetical protein
VDDLKAVLHDAHGLQLLATVAAVEHERVHQALDDRAVGLAERPLVIAGGAVGEVLRVLSLGGDVILQTRTCISQPKLRFF